MGDARRRRPRRAPPLDGDRDVDVADRRRGVHRAVDRAQPRAPRPAPARRGPRGRRRGRGRVGPQRRLGVGAVPGLPSRASRPTSGRDAMRALRARCATAVTELDDVARAEGIDVRLPPRRHGHARALRAPGRRACAHELDEPRARSATDPRTSAAGSTSARRAATAATRRTCSVRCTRRTAPRCTPRSSPSGSPTRRSAAASTIYERHARDRDRAGDAVAPRRGGDRVGHGARRRRRARDRGLHPDAPGRAARRRPAVLARRRDRAARRGVLRRASGSRDRETFCDGRHLIIYGQRTADDRLVFGGRGAPYHFGSTRRRRASTTSPRVSRSSHATLAELFGDAARPAHPPLGRPARRRARLSPRRCGSTARPGMASAGGYVGDGVVLSHVAGRALADLIAGAATARTRAPLRRAPLARAGSPSRSGGSGSTAGSSPRAWRTAARTRDGPRRRGRSGSSRAYGAAERVGRLTAAVRPAP